MGRLFPGSFRFWGKSLSPLRSVPGLTDVLRGNIQKLSGTDRSDFPLFDVTCPVPRIVHAPGVPYKQLRAVFFIAHILDLSTAIYRRFSMTDFSIMFPGIFAQSLLVLSVSHNAHVHHTLQTFSLLPTMGVHMIPAHTTDTPVGRKIASFGPQRVAS